MKIDLTLTEIARLRALLNQDDGQKWIFKRLDDSILNKLSPNPLDAVDFSVRQFRELVEATQNTEEK